MEDKKAPCSTEQIKSTLEEQFLFLANRSKATYGKELADLTDAMIKVAFILAPELQNQSFYAASTYHPYVVQLPVKDLLALYAARIEEKQSSGHSRRI